ncbi:hypothetical protein M5X00_13405 [Paenibacillus alvei]|uniref:hypothetical protein n=1 Tax=Paenibacillus alvei TaxID=44250 RepID=UPI0002887A8B|nr:hypothetical protein [Paenibacillus alvei]EJW13873.1 hypothetical protein PAV_109p01030 [Paenibacillus alvei DSM 29]MCY9540479.1 hypothetical protein [Paenibacillus alvei]MCY9708316.1 hypothetical protein [Paenibacillus alvei]MCY9732996.1 hypothetical protein [Paenibacillus alvei]MCY9755238.1 hypothetical protein [Paenibacillus alvei]
MSWEITGIAFLLCLLFLMAFVIIAMKEDGKTSPANVWRRYFTKQRIGARINRILLKSYVVFDRIPVLSKYKNKVRKRLEVLQVYDELNIRKQTMKISLIALSTVAFSSLAIIIFNEDVVTTFLVVLGAVVINGLITDTFVHRIEDRLLKNSVNMFEDTAVIYEELNIVEDAIFEAAQSAHPDAAKHGNKIYEILQDKEPKKALESYHTVSPNRWYRFFARMALWVKEYGDRQVKNGSLFKQSIGKLVSEMNYELRRRDRLNYILKGLATVAILPVLFTGALRDWAKNNFPIMDEFYNSKAGLLILISFYALVLISYLIVRKMLENDEAKYMGNKNRIEWEKFLYEKTPARIVVDSLKPKSFHSRYKKLSLLLKQANSHLTVEWLYIQRIVVTILCFIVTISVFVLMHINTTSNILYNPIQGFGMYGKLSEADLSKAKENTAFDRGIISKLKNMKQVDKETIVQVVSGESDVDRNDKTVLSAANRIYEKYNLLQVEYFKWWELVTGILISMIAFNSPVWLLILQKRIREMEMHDEVDQFNSVISILREFERMDVETLLEWLEPFAVIFQEPIRKCINEYSSGCLSALESMKEESPFPEFQRLVDKFINAVERVPLRVAFDDLERAQEHYREIRKEHHNRIIEKKAFYGSALGLAPLFYLVTMYLVVPMIYLSVSEMGSSMRHIRNL